MVRSLCAFGLFAGACGEEPEPVPETNATSFVFVPGPALQPNLLQVERVALPPALARLGTNGGVPTLLPVPPGKYRHTALSPSGDDLYAYRSEVPEIIGPQTLLWFDLQTGDSAILADTGAGSDFSGFVGKRFYGPRQVEDFTKQALTTKQALVAAERGRRLDVSRQLPRITDMCAVHGKLALRVAETDDIVLLDGGEHAVLVNGDGLITHEFAACSPTQDRFILRSILGVFRLIEFEGWTVTRDAHVESIKDRGGLEYRVEQFMPDGRVLVIERQDTNGDGFANLVDDRSERIGFVGAKDLDFYPLTNLGAFVSISDVAVLPTGEIAVLDSIKGGETLAVINGSAPVDWLRITSKTLVRVNHMYIADDGRFVFQVTIGGHRFKNDSVYLGWVP